MADIEQLVQEYSALHLDEIIDYNKFNHYAIVHHSTSIEGSTLTENETRLLLDEGVTPKGKPLEHSLMATDHYKALVYTLESAKERVPCTVAFIQKINSLVLAATGKMYNTVLGNVDASKGEFRKGNVSAGGHYFMNYDKVETHTKILAGKINDAVTSATTLNEKLELSFDAHFDFVTIHPFYDGNGRTYRLLMNYIQELYKVPLAIVYKEDRNEYFTALQQTRETEDMELFRRFMYGQYEKYLLQELRQYKQDLGNDIVPMPKGKGKGFTLF